MSGMGVRAEVGKAIEELKQAFPSSKLAVSEDGDGGAHVVIDSVCIGQRYTPDHSWLGGHITAQYPYADIYPVFMDASIRRLDGKSFEAPITEGMNFVVGRQFRYPDATTKCKIPDSLLWPSFGRLSTSWKSWHEYRNNL